MMGIDRQSIIKTVYGALAGNTTPLDSIVYYQSDAAYKPDFAKWNFNPAKALALLKKHCTGGPTSPCRRATPTLDVLRLPGSVPLHVDGVERDPHDAGSDHQGSSSSRSASTSPTPRCPANVVFGPTGIPSGNYDLADFAWVTSPDPAGFVPIWGCGGESNYMNYCNRSGDQASRGVATVSSTSAKRATLTSSRPTRCWRTTSRPSRCTRGRTRSSGSRACSG